MRKIIVCLLCLLCVVSCSNRDDLIDKPIKVIETYESAVKSFESGDIESAYSIFSGISDYSNSNTYIQYIEAVKWYESEFPDILNTIAYKEIISFKKNGEYFDIISSNLESLRLSNTQLNIADAYSELILKSMYDACSEKCNSNQFANYYRMLSFLIDNEYQIDNCSKMIKDFENKFSGIAGKYMYNSIIFHDVITVKINIETMQLEIEPSSDAIVYEPKCLFELNDSCIYEKNSHVFTFSKNKITYNLSSLPDLTFEYEMFSKDTELFSEISFY